MGSCVSVHESRAESAMKLDVSYVSKTNNLFVPESTTISNSNNKHLTVDPPRKTFDNGSEEETFFDSQPWLDSDCDDFFSVNGDFIPSCGTTPVHYSASRGSTPIHHTFTSQVNKISSDPSPIAQPSPTDKKKRLSELFKDSVKEEDGNDNISTATNEKKATILDILPKSANTTPYISGTNSACSGERTPNLDMLPDREKTMKPSQCCLPSLVSCRSFSGRKKKIMSPAVAINGEA